MYGRMSMIGARVHSQNVVPCHSIRKLVSFKIDTPNSILWNNWCNTTQLLCCLMKWRHTSEKAWGVGRVWWLAPSRWFWINVSYPKTVWEERVLGAVGGIFWLCSTVTGGKWTHRITQRYSEVFCGGAWEKQPSGRRTGKLKVAVYGEGVLADSGIGLRRGKRSIQGPAFLPMQSISYHLSTYCWWRLWLHLSRTNFTDSLLIFSLYFLI